LGEGAFGNFKGFQEEGKLGINTCLIIETYTFQKCGWSDEMFYVEEGRTQAGRFVKFQIDSFYGNGGGLQFIAVSGKNKELYVLYDNQLIWNAYRFYVIGRQLTTSASTSSISTTTTFTATTSTLETTKSEEKTTTAKMTTTTEEKKTTTVEMGTTTDTSVTNTTTANETPTPASSSTSNSTDASTTGGMYLL
jgi:hypothetical protein